MCYYLNMEGDNMFFDKNKEQELEQQFYTLSNDLKEAIQKKIDTKEIDLTDTKPIKSKYFDKLNLGDYLLIANTKFYFILNSDMELVAFNKIVTTLEYQLETDFTKIPLLIKVLIYVIEQDLDKLKVLLSNPLNLLGIFKQSKIGIEEFHNNGTLDDENYQKLKSKLAQII